MAIEKNFRDGILVVNLRGELDHHAVESIRNEIEEALGEVHYRGLVMSFRGIDFMDSSGLGLILGRYRTLTQKQRKMALCEVNTTLRRIFELSGILKVVPLYDMEGQAVQFVREE